MKSAKRNVVQVWKELHDVLIPRLRLTVSERAVYSHLLRHSYLEGRRSLRFSIAWLGRGARLTESSARDSLRRLVAKEVLRLVERSRAGHVVEVRLPSDIATMRGERVATKAPAELTRASNLEEIDFLLSRARRQAIHEREWGYCFYCLRRVSSRVRCIDHVVPRARSGRNSYRNLVSVCMECNSQKGERTAADFLRSLYRDRRLTDAELNSRLRALDTVASGKLLPILPLRRPPSRQTSLTVINPRPKFSRSPAQTNNQRGISLLFRIVNWTLLRRQNLEHHRRRV